MFEIDQTHLIAADKQARRQTQERVFIRNLCLWCTAPPKVSSCWEETRTT